jgi:hypothetical protein
LSNYNETTGFLQDVASQAMTAASNNASRLYSLPGSVSLRNPRFDVELKKPVIGPPPAFSDLFVGGDSTDPTIRYMDDQADKWLEKFFPEMNGGFRNQPEETLCNILSGVKPFGIDRTIFDLVWHQARDRAYRTVSSEQRAVEASFSGRGFTLPPGAMVDTLAQIEQRATDTILDVNRDQAIKDADIKQRMLEIGLQLSAQLKTGVLAAMADFYRMWISLPDKDIERARIRAQAMGSFYSALSSYHNVEMAFQELTLRAAQLRSVVDVDVDRNALARQNNSAAATGALGSAVNAFAGIASSAAQAGGSLTAEIETL